MAHKISAPAAKQNLIMDWFHKTAEAYTLKELEKILPMVASINSMQVKEHIQTLVDDDRLRVEKIGSGNWYWSFVSDTKNTRENLVLELNKEKNRLQTALSELLLKIKDETVQREEDDDLEDGSIAREALLCMHSDLLQNIDVLETELAAYRENDPEEFDRKVQVITQMKNEATRWTDNLEAVESYMIKETNDKPGVQSILAELCGGEYIAQEGFLEL